MNRRATFSILLSALFLLGLAQGATAQRRFEIGVDVGISSGAVALLFGTPFEWQLPGTELPTTSVAVKTGEPYEYGEYTNAFVTSGIDAYARVTNRLLLGVDITFGSVGPSIIWGRYETIDGRFDYYWYTLTPRGFSLAPGAVIRVHDGTRLRMDIRTAMVIAHQSGGHRPTDDQDPDGGLSFTYRKFSNGIWVPGVRAGLEIEFWPGLLFSPRISLAVGASHVASVPGYDEVEPFWMVYEHFELGFRIGRD